MHPAMQDDICAPLLIFLGGSTTGVVPAEVPKENCNIPSDWQHVQHEMLN